jgi:hypothetical protein
MYIPKRYGESKIAECPFCSKPSFTKNKQKIPVCKDHVDKMMPEIKCVCGSYLDLKESKYGPFFVCMNCGTMNLKKGMEMLSLKKSDAKEAAPLQQKVPVNRSEGKDESILDSGKYKDFDYGID